MAKLSQLTIPVKNPSTGTVTPQTFDLAGSGGGGSDTNFIGTKAEYDALPSSEKENYDSMDFTDYHDGLNIDPTPMINSKNPVASGGVYAALQNVNSEIENLEEGVTNATELVAPLEQTLVATRSYSVGDQFVYNGFLYKVTAAIPFDSAIVIGTNCELAPNVVEQIGDLTDRIDTLNATVTDLKTVKTITGSGNYGSSYIAYKYGNVVFLKVYNITAAQNQNLNIVALPEGYRPKNICLTVALNGYGSMSYSALCTATVSTTGVVYLYTYTAFSNGYLNATYIV